MGVAIMVILISGVLGLVWMSLENRTDNQQEAQQAANWQLLEYWENYPTPDYGALHTYCKVRMKDSGKLVYYRTRNPELHTGDLVYVPFGRREEKKVGKIVSMRRCRGYLAPRPLDKTQYIIGKIHPKRKAV